ncbi:LAMI_0A06942g1_1 [Lachancea mirantina]|uniref:LAMI_0A06942g1_1 n=1 Tax=Lachancea mirantina TaxID=1230905 RepID=A0A1G4IQN0_9SACH|nr:LAMI_0A06942g1_1 [Lachancea mirantina]
MAASQRRTRNADVSTDPKTGSKKPKPGTKTAEPVTPKRTLYVSNLNDKIKIATLRENLYLLFSTYGEVVNVAMSPKTRGQAFVFLQKLDEANLALITLQDEPFFGKPLRIAFSRHETRSVGEE